MATKVSIVPDLIDALVALFADQLPDVMVTDGYDVTENYGDALWIGVDDPTSMDAAGSASFEQTWAGASFATRDETGTITCAASSSNGDGDAKAARDGVFAIAATVQEQLRLKSSLTVDGLNWTNFAGGELRQQQDDMGAYALLIFRIAFRARLS